MNHDALREGMVEVLIARDYRDATWSHSIRPLAIDVDRLVKIASAIRHQGRGLVSVPTAAAGVDAKPKAIEALARARFVEHADELGLLFVNPRDLPRRETLDAMLRRRGERGTRPIVSLARKPHLSPTERGAALKLANELLTGYRVDLGQAAIDARPAGSPPTGRASARHDRGSNEASKNAPFVEFTPAIVGRTLASLDEVVRAATLREEIHGLRAVDDLTLSHFLRFAWALRINGRNLVSVPTAAAAKGVSARTLHRVAVDGHLIRYESLGLVFLEVDGVPDADVLRQRVGTVGAQPCRRLACHAPALPRELVDAALALQARGWRLAPEHVSAPDDGRSSGDASPPSAESRTPPAGGERRCIDAPTEDPQASVRAHIELGDEAQRQEAGGRSAAGEG
jgi:hypothetical protein